jgi:hypothetical protein
LTGASGHSREALPLRAVAEAVDNGSKGVKSMLNVRESWLASRGVAGTGQDRKARVPGKGWVGLRQLAEQKPGVFGRFDEPGVLAVGTEPEL